MTGRDLVWRAAGACLFVGGCTASAIARDGSPWVGLHFLIAVLGIVLVLNGKRVAVAIRAERRGHCNTAAAVHAARLRRLHRSGKSSDF